jgi:hypothetical protein
VSRSPSKSSSQSAPAVVVGLSAAGSVWRSPLQQDWQTESTRGTHDRGQAIAALIKATQDRLTVHAPTPILWLVSFELMPTWLQLPPPGIRSLPELHAVAQARATQLFGAVDSSDWQLSAQWHHRQPFLATATPSMWGTSLGSRITSSLHLLLHAAQSQWPRSGWVAITSANYLYILHRQHQQWTHLRSLQLSATVNPEAYVQRVHDEWQREALKTEATPGQLHWLHAGRIPLPTLPAHIKKVRLSPLINSKSANESLTGLEAVPSDLQALASDTQVAHRLLHGDSP